MKTEMEKIDGLRSSWLDWSESDESGGMEESGMCLIKFCDFKEFHYDFYVLKSFHMENQA